MKLLLLLAILLQGRLASSFVSVQQPSSTCRQAPSTQLFADPGGMKRGGVLMAVSLTICVWSFSIPTEFRRARLCSPEESAVYEQCKTADQWIEGVKEYYRNGGGIKFDFSIDPGTLEENEEFKKVLMGE